MLEKRDVKKDSDPKNKKLAAKKKVSSHVALVTLPQTQCSNVTMPSLKSIRQDAFIQSQVDQRLKELSQSDNTGKKIKSLRGGPVEFVLSGFKKERIQYDQLSVVQWVAGYWRILREEQNPQVREHSSYGGCSPFFLGGGKCFVELNR